MLALEESLSQLQEHLHSFKHKSSPVACRFTVAGAEHSSSGMASKVPGPTSSPPSGAPKQLGKGGWVTVRGKHGSKKSGT